MTPLTPAAVTALTPEQEHILRHMLGIDDPAKNNPKPYRDYYCANPNWRGSGSSGRVYLAFLHISDCCTDLTFREFLTSPDFADARRDA